MNLKDYSDSIESYMERKEITHLVNTVKKIEDNITIVFVGKKNQIRMLLLGFCSGLHVLIEDVPGVGKTTLARSLAASIGLDFGRIQFTPDLLPGDIVGMTIWSPEKREFLYKEGAIMHQFVLADEINRATPRTQSSLLEAMQEGNVTVDGKTYTLPDTFFVLATQNPENFVGAFPLPEGELDRFGLSFSIGYPTDAEEVKILERFQEDNPLETLKPVTDTFAIMQIREAVKKIFASEKIKQYIVSVTGKTRTSRYIKLGSSPRASQHLLLASQASAFMKSRDFVIPEDIMETALYVLAHRLVLSTEARVENKHPYDVIQEILKKTPVPTGLNGK